MVVEFGACESGVAYLGSCGGEASSRALNTASQTCAALERVVEYHKLQSTTACSTTASRSWLPHRQSRAIFM